MKWEDCVLVQGKWSPKRAAPLCGVPVSILAWYNTRKHNYGKSVMAGLRTQESHGRFENTD